MDQPNAPDPTAWAIHGAIHRNAPHARCVLHVHSKYALALATLKDPSMPPIDQNTMRFYNRISYDMGFDGMGLGDEAERLSNSLGHQQGHGDGPSRRADQRPRLSPKPSTRSITSSARPRR